MRERNPQKAFSTLGVERETWEKIKKLSDATGQRFYVITGRAVDLYFAQIESDRRTLEAAKKKVE